MLDINFNVIYLVLFFNFLTIAWVFVLRNWFQGGQFQKKDIRIDGKVVVITGANTGIGKETALELANRGGKIYLACRDDKKANEARLEIISKTGNKLVFARHLDLTSFASVRKFAEEFRKEEPELHILINNAGVIGGPHTITADGVESHMATNHFGHFLLTNLLLDTMKAAAPSRIINVSSIVHQFGSINRDDLNLNKCYIKSYNNSKLANVLFTRELSKRLAGTGVVVNSLHPGVVNTDIKRNLTVVSIILYPLRPFFKSAKSGAQTTIALALDPDLKTVTGKYFSDCKITRESAAARSDDTAKWLWETSENVTALKK